MGLGGDGAVVVVTVTAADGATTATYTVTVGRGGAAPAAAVRVGLGGIGDLGFEPLVRRYDARVPPGVLSTRVEMVGAGDTALEGFAVTAGDSAVTAVGPDGAVALSQHADTLVVVHAATARNERQGVYTVLLRASRQSPVPARSSRQAPGSRLSGLQARGSLTDAVRSQGILVVEPRLSGLALSQGTLAPVFAAGTPEYTAQVTSATSQVTVTPTAAPGVTVLVAAPDADPDAVGHQVALNASTADSSAQTAVVIVVWNSAGELDSYTLTITRAATSTGDATLSALTVGALALLPAFDPATTEYTATAAADTATVTVTATKTQSGATATVTPTDADDDTAGDQVDLTADDDHRHHRHRHRPRQHHQDLHRHRHPTPRAALQRRHPRQPRHHRRRPRTRLRRERSFPEEVTLVNCPKAATLHDLGTGNETPSRDVGRGHLHLAEPSPTPTSAPRSTTASTWAAKTAW